MSSLTAQPYGADGLMRPAPSDLSHRVRDSLHEVSDKFAQASARRRDRRAQRHASRLPSSGGVLLNLGDAFAFTDRRRAA